MCTSRLVAIGDKLLSVQEQLQTLERTLGRNVRARRISADLTQEQVARRANISVGAVKGLEAGRGTNVSTLLAVSRVLGVTDWVDRLAPPPPQFSPLEMLAQQRKAGARRPAEATRVRRSGVR